MLSQWYLLRQERIDGAGRRLNLLGSTSFSVPSGSDPATQVLYVVTNGNRPCDQGDGDDQWPAVPADSVGDTIILLGCCDLIKSP